MCAVFGVPGTYRAIQSVADGTAIPLHDVVIHAPRLTVPGLTLICVPPDGGVGLAGGAPPPLPDEVTVHVNERDTVTMPSFASTVTL